MIINSIYIKKFRGFHNINLKLGEQLTVIAGQNGTQKTTVLGMLSQPFSITDKTNPLYGEKPLCGGNYRSSFAEKFKLSASFDTPKSHEWTLVLNKNNEFTVESIPRDSSNLPVRFWKKGDRSRGSGYIQLPVVYLSLSRLFPIGEDNGINSSNDIKLTEKEFYFYQEWHNKILIIPDIPMVSVNYLSSKQKNTLGVNTSFYDWNMNSAGQDNIGKILLSILSFKRLQEKHKDKYEGGILAIDELDATLYPASQLKLLQALRKFASKFNIQIIFTTHSLNLLESACNLQKDSSIKGQTKVIFLEKRDSKIKPIQNITYDTIKNKLNVALDEQPNPRKITIFTEDKEGKLLTKAIIKQKFKNLNFIDCTFGGDNLIELVRKKVPGFSYPNSIIILDGDVQQEKSKMKRINKLDNILVLPGENSPERIIANYLYNLNDDSIIWDEIYPSYTKQIVFKDISYNEIMKDRVKAKSWFNEQSPYWGRNCARVINPWIKENKNKVNNFIDHFDQIYKKIQ